MAKLGSDKRPAVVRVRTMPKGEEIVALCEKHHWKVIVGIEPDQPEDLSDIDLLLRGPAGEPPAGPRRRRSMSERSSGWSGSIPTITFQWCFSQSATICSPLGIVRTRTTAGRLSDPNFAILDSPCEHRNSSLSACLRFRNPHGQP